MLTENIINKESVLKRMSLKSFAKLSLSVTIVFMLTLLTSNSVNAQNWSMLGNYLNHTGVQNSTIPSYPKLAWFANTSSGFESGPVVADGMVFASSVNANYTYAFNETTGALIWETNVNGIAQNSVPAVADGRVFVTADINNSNGIFYALNETNGNIIWSFNNGNGYDSSPAVDNGVVFIGSSNASVNKGALEAFNASNGNLLWAYQTLGYVISSPAVDSGMVFITVGYSANISGVFGVYAVNETTGALIWNYTTYGQMDSSPTIANGLVYVGDGNNFYAFNETTGTKIWNYSSSNTIYTTPAVDNGIVYYGVSDGTFNALNASTGALIWNESLSTTSAGGIRSNPAIASGVVLTTTSSGVNLGILFALNDSNGKILWDYVYNASLYSEPAIADGMIFIGGLDGIYAFENGTPPTQQSWDTYHHYSNHTGVTNSTIPFTLTNTTAWVYETGNPPNTPSVNNTIWGEPAVDSGMVFIGTNNKNFYAFNETTGSVIWTHLTNGYSSASPTVANGMVFTSSEGDNLYALDERTGNTVWNYTMNTSAGASVDNGMLFVGDNINTTYALNEFSGALIWNFTTGAVFQVPAVADGMVFVGSWVPPGGTQVKYSNNLFAFNETTGALIWNYTVPLGISYSAPAVANGMVFVTSNNNTVYAFNESNGNLIWNYSNNTGNYAYGIRPTVADGMVFVGGNGNTSALNESNGNLIWSTYTGNSGSSSSIANGVVYTGGYNSIFYALNETTGSVIWTYNASKGYFSDPAVADGMIFVGSETGNVYAFTNVAGVNVSCASNLVFIGSGVQCNATAFDANNNPLNYSFVWSVSNSSVGSVNQTGFFTANSLGVVSVQATAGGVTGVFNITVTPTTASTIGVSVVNTNNVVNDTVIVNFTVQNSYGQNVNSSLNVTVNDSAGTTANVTVLNGFGQFNFTETLAGVYNLNVFDNTNHSATNNVNFTFIPSYPNNLTISVVPNPNLIVGGVSTENIQVTDYWGNPVNTTVNVTVNDSTSTTSNVTITNGVGVFQFTENNPGAYNVTAVGWDYAYPSNSVIITFNPKPVTYYNVTSCENITTPGYYILNQSINFNDSVNYCIQVNASNVTIDGNGFSITSSDYNGYNTAVLFNNTYNTTVFNLIIYNASYGFSTRYYSNNTNDVYNAKLLTLNNNYIHNTIFGIYGSFNDSNFYENTLINDNNINTGNTAVNFVTTSTNPGGVYGSNVTFNNNTIIDLSSVQLIGLVEGGDTFSNNNVYAVIYYEGFEGSNFYYFNLINNTFNGYTLSTKDYMDTEGNFQSNFYFANNIFNMTNIGYIFNPVEWSNTTNFTFINNTINTVSTFGHENFYNSSFINNKNLGGFSGDVFNNVTFYNNTNINHLNVGNSTNVYFINDTFQNLNSNNFMVSNGIALIQAPVDFTILNSSLNPIPSNLTVSDINFNGSANNLSLSLPAGVGQLNVTTYYLTNFTFYPGIWNVFNASSTGLASNSKVRTYLETTEFPISFILLPQAQTCGSMNLTSSDNLLVYDLQSNSGDCLYLNTLLSNATLDCNVLGTSSLIQGVGNGSGVVFNSSNIKLQNCVINNFSNGLTDLSSNNTAYNDYLLNVNTGFNSINASNSYYDNNTFVNTTTGYYIINGSNSTIINNTFQNQSSFDYGGFMESGNGVVNPINVSNSNNLIITQNNFNYTNEVNVSNSNNLSITQNNFNYSNGVNVLNSANPQIFNNTFFATTYNVNAVNVLNLNYSFNNYSNTNIGPVNLNYDLRLDNGVNTTISNNELVAVVSGFINSGYIILNSLNTVLENLITAQAQFNSVNVSNSVNTLIINSVLQSDTAVSDFNSTNMTMTNNQLSSVLLNQSNSDVITNNAFNIPNSNLNAYNTFNETITSNNFSYNGGYGSNINLTNPENSVVSNNFLINSLNLQNATNNTLIYNNSVESLSSLNSSNITVQNNSIASFLNSTGDSNDNISGNTINTTNFFSTQNTVFSNNNLTASYQSLNVFNSNNLSIQSNQLYNPASITSYYLTSKMLFNTSAVEVFAVADGSAIMISSDGTTLPEVGGGSDLSVSYVYVNVASANVTVLSQNKYYSNCSQVLTTVLTYLGYPANFTCWDYETVFKSNGVGKSYSYQPPVNLTLQNGLTSPPYVSPSVINDWNTLIANSSNVSINSDSDGLVYFNNTSNSILNSTNTTKIVFLNSLNDTVLNVTGIRNNIVDYGGSNYTIAWFLKVLTQNNGVSMNASVNVTNALGLLRTLKSVNGETPWIAVEDYNSQFGSVTNYNPYLVSASDPLSGYYTINQTETILLDPSTVFNAVFQPDTVVANSLSPYATTLNISDATGSNLTLTCSSPVNWLVLSCPASITNGSYQTVSVLLYPQFLPSAGTFSTSITVYGDNGAGTVYYAQPTFYLQYYPNSGGGGSIPIPSGYNVTISGGGSIVTINPTNPTTPISNVSTSNQTLNASNQTLNVSTQNNTVSSNATPAKQPLITITPPATTQDYLNWLLIIGVIIVVIAYVYLKLKK